MHVSACVFACVCVCVCMCACACFKTVRVCLVWALCGIYSSARGVGGRARVVAFGAHRPGSPALAAGLSWTSRTASAPWSPRFSHTSVIDAAGAIYVIGGTNGNAIYQDVWSDGGARPDCVTGVGGKYIRWVPKGIVRGARRVLLGTQGHSAVLADQTGICGGIRV
jgi:hypothetical protein